MGLLTEYNDSNKVTNTALNIKYSVEEDSFTATNPDGTSSTTRYYRCTRYAQKQYMYVGMDYTTALSCQNAKISQYTRNYSRITGESGPYPETFLGCTSDIVAQHQDGGMWNVIISVNETDEKPSATVPSNVATLFSTENQRNYDE